MERQGSNELNGYFLYLYFVNKTDVYFCIDVTNLSVNLNLF